MDPLVGKLSGGLRLAGTLSSMVLDRDDDRVYGILATLDRMLKELAGSCRDMDWDRLVEEGVLVKLANPGCGPLMVYKDNYMRVGEASSLGTGYLTLFPGRTSSLIEAMERIGYKSLGRGNMHELGLGTTNVNPHTGTPVNPAAPGRIPGGSSGGSAAAVSMGAADLGLGTDAAGSIRVPAAFTGVYGFKPSSRIVSREGFYTFMPSLEVPGFLAKSPMHLLLPLWLSGLISLEDILSIVSSAGSRVFMVYDWATGRVEEEVGEGFYKVIDLVEARIGDWINVVLVRDTSGGWFREAERLRALIALHEAYVNASWVYEKYRDLMGDDVRRIIELGSRIPPGIYREALDVLRTSRRIARAALSADLILLPTVPIDAPRVEEATPELSASSTLTWLTGPWNLVDLPAASLPVSRVRLPSGIPYPLQLAAPHGDEWLLAYSIILDRVLNR